MVDTNITHYSDDALGQLLEQFNRDLNMGPDVAQMFNEKYSEGYEIIMKALTAWKRDHREHQNIQLKCFKILVKLFKNSKESMKLFFTTKGAIKFFTTFIQRVIKKDYLNYSAPWIEFMNLINQMQNQDFAETTHIIFDECRFVMIASPMLLDSDNLEIDPDV